MSIVEKYELISKIGYISAIVFFVVTIILFFTLRIPATFGYLTGITRKKAINDIRKKNEGSGQTSDRLLPDGRVRRSVTAKIGGVDITSKIQTSKVKQKSTEETTLLNSGTEETTLLQSRQGETVLLDNGEDKTIILYSNPENRSFEIIKDITFVHSNVNI